VRTIAERYAYVPNSIDKYALLWDARIEINPLAKITVLLSDEEFQRFQAFCAQKGYKKSTLIARLIREHLDQEGIKKQSGNSRTDMEKSKHR
jgi:hypothetical protein